MDAKVTTARLREPGCDATIDCGIRRIEDPVLNPLKHRTPLVGCGRPGSILKKIQYKLIILQIIGHHINQDGLIDFGQSDPP